MTPYQENRLYVLGVRIEKLEQNTSFFKKNLLKVIGFGIAFSFWFPFYTGDDHHGIHQDNDSMLERLNIDYFSMVLAVLIIYTILCIIAHITFSIQDKYKLKQLHKQLQEIKDSIAADKANENHSL